ncbi:hypothetical protein P691DRAFT_760339 [Macrolepiota fuliginosa MF-IS2]|uniref:Cell cycle checkpoint control protein RAD9A n=1 Tax=Macrolepiota fuliginosa MF-IS2 TaxID=1400762 RepID=A0A9P6C460_9AGAR|nr:hypothetical protein P691DRAFT_760339 [Macrolepiota fuliginosa MF-IS2]
MQATIHASALKSFTKALTCLARYGDELTICAYPDSLSLSATNSAKSAFCRFKYEKEFFSRYNIGKPRRNISDGEGEGLEETQTIKGQLLAKNLLSILKHRTVERSVERCELSIVEGTGGDEGSDEEIDSLESKLIVKLLCKHGVVKTHRLLLSIPIALLAPGVPDTPNQARVNIGPGALRNMLEHFPMQKGAKADPQLIWTFNESEVGLKTCESSMDKGKSQISTELNISAEEFDAYELYTSPIIIAFHLREFNATIAYAESMTLSLDMCFTDTIAPLYIDVEGDCTQGLFVIATSQPPGVPVPISQNSYRPMSNKKRDREETPTDLQRPKRGMKIVQRVDADAASRYTAQSRQSSRMPDSMPPPLSPGPGSFRPLSVPVHQPSLSPVPNKRREQQEPLFLPSSQLSIAENNFLKEAGLGDIGTAEELNALLEEDGEEVDFSPSQAQRASDSKQIKDDEMKVDGAPESFELVEETGFGPTQATQKGFQPLFND